MIKKVPAVISVGLKDLIKREKNILQKIEKKRRGKRKRRITMVDASQSLARKLSK